MIRKVLMLILVPCLVSIGPAHAQSTQLAGNVTLQNGQPVVGASIIVGSYSVVTDRSGHYELENLRPGQYAITVIPPNKRPRSFTVIVAARSTRHDFRVDW